MLSLEVLFGVVEALCECPPHNMTELRDSHYQVELLGCPRWREWVFPFSNPVRIHICGTLRIVTVPRSFCACAQLGTPAPEVMSGVNRDPSLPVGPYLIRRQCRQPVNTRVLRAIQISESPGRDPRRHLQHFSAIITATGNSRPIFCPI